MYFSKLKQQTIISLSLFFSSLLSVQALTLIQQSQDELIRSTDLIVHATVMKTETHSGGSQQFAYSISTLRVHSAFKGQSSHTLYVYQSGGVFKGLSQRIIGQELLKEGQEWTLFLAPMPKNERTEQIFKALFKTQSKQETLYRLISGPLASKQVFTDEQGHKSVKLGTPPTTKRLGASTGTHGTQQEQVKPSLKIVKVKTRPKLQLKAPIFKLKPSIKDDSEASPKAQAKTQPKQQPQAKSKAFELYIDELKTAIDRSLAPKVPTH